MNSKKIFFAFTLLLLSGSLVQADTCGYYTYKNGETICGECSDGYYLDEEFECQACAANCQYCTGEDITDCFYPVNGYGWNSDEEDLTECESGCAICPNALSSKCYAYCDDYYYESDQSGDGEVTCEDCPDNCVSCSYSSYYDSLWCSSCESGYAIDISENDEECTDECGSNCLYCYSANSYCSYCKSGYSSVSGVCVQDSVSNDDDVVCDSGEYESNGECKSCSSHCEYCYSSSYCYTCEDGYYNSYGECKKCEVDNCDYCSSYSTDYCYTCADYYSYGFDPEENNDNSDDDDFRRILISTYYDYGSCKACSKFGDNCLDCDFQSGICTDCETGYVFDTETESCVGCDIDNCITCATPGICQECIPGYYPSSGTCAKCDASCATCNGGSADECSTCPVNKWSFWKPYATVPEIDYYAEYGYVTRDPGPYAETWIGNSMSCVDVCPDTTSEGDNVEVFEELMTCWASVDQQDLTLWELMPGLELSTSTATDIWAASSTIIDTFESGLFSTQMTTDWEKDEYTYLRKPNYISKDLDKYNINDNCYWNGEIDENIDPIGRRAPYCDCTGKDGEPLFWGLRCEILYTYRLSGEAKLRTVFDAAISFGVTNHQEAVYLIDAIVEMLSSGMLHIRDVATGVDRIMELSEYIDTDAYYFFWDRIIEGIPDMAEPLQIAVTTQLSLADKSYEWDDPNARRLVGSVTEGDMRNSLQAIMRAFEQGYENIGDIYQYYISNYESSGIIAYMFEVDEWDLGDNYYDCTFNYLGIENDGYLVDDEDYSEYYGCLASSWYEYYKNEDYLSYAFEVLVNDDDALTDNKMFVFDIAQYLAVFLTETERAVTNLLFVGARRESGEEIELGTVTVTLVPAWEFPGSISDIECGVMSQDADSGEYFIDSDVDCSKSTDDYGNRIICECDIDSGWIVGYISSEDAIALIESEAKDGKYEVAFGAREAFSFLLALVYFLFLS